MFCSNACQLRAKYKRKKQAPKERAQLTKRCGQCDGPFQTPYAYRAYCSPECKAAHDWDQRKARKALAPPKVKTPAIRPPRQEPPPPIGSRRWRTTATVEQIAAYRKAAREYSRRRYELRAEEERRRVSIYRLANPEKMTKWGDPRKLILAERSDGTITAPVLRRAFKLTTHCPYCREEMPPRDRILEHIVPIKRGGKHSADNTLVACVDCNYAKGTKLLSEWRPELANLRLTIAEQAARC
jgi:5-methylcytosine-specific restriction endonuclease McrA